MLILYPYMQNEINIFKVIDDKGYEDFVTLMKQ